MAGLFFDNNERQGRVKDLFGSFNDIRQEISDTVASVVTEGAQLKIALELLQGKGQVASMQELEAKAKAQMTDEEYKEYKELIDKVEKTDHDLWVAWSVMMWIDAGYATGEPCFQPGFKFLSLKTYFVPVMLPIEITSRIGAFMVGRALNQAINAAQLGGEIPAAAQNLVANGTRAMRPRAGAFHIPAGDAQLARLQRLEKFEKFMGKMTRIGRIVGLVLLATTLVLVAVDVIIQDSQRTDLMNAITDLYGARHIVKQLAMALKSEARHITDARILLNERATKESTLSGLVAEKTISAAKKDELMAAYDAQKKAEIEARSPSGGIPLPSDQDVYNALKARDDLHKSWQNNDPDMPKLQEWLKAEAERPHGEK
ncbi:hypothetical protein CVT25_000944 [Psilocybe cyanescens]|uniref:Uncharacterized protein n=1 Tax=Psilocybe cyanescens TaxID=93625 RepID=A0A409X8P9_PSICY|nr:hypothetical protein CVT25_000944 [Psilocybe cyanescens]